MILKTGFTLVNQCYCPNFAAKAWGMHFLIIAKRMPANTDSFVFARLIAPIRIRYGQKTTVICMPFGKDVVISNKRS